MSAAADYAAAVRALSRPLPAYVTYTVHSHVTAGPGDKNESRTIVVRTSDGKIVRGTAPSVQFGEDSKYHGDAVSHPPFDPHCYAASAAHDGSFEGRPAEALAIADTCKKEHAGDGDFDTLYVDPQTHEPVAASGGNHDDSVAVRVVQRFAPAGGFILPSTFDVDVHGSGVMFWLNVVVRQTYGAFAFSDEMP